MSRRGFVGYLGLAIAALLASAPVAAQTTGDVTGAILASDTGQPLPQELAEAVRVGLWDGTTYRYPGLGIDSFDIGPDGTYTIGGVIPGQYYVNIYLDAPWMAGEPYDEHFYYDSWYPGIFDRAFWSGILPATPVVVTAGETTSGVDFSLKSGGRVRVLLEDLAGQPIDAAPFHPSLVSVGGSLLWQHAATGHEFWGWDLWSTGIPGEYMSEPVPVEDRYSMVAFPHKSPALRQYYPGVTAFHDRQYFDNVPLRGYVDLQMTLPEGGQVSGTFKDASGGSVTRGSCRVTYPGEPPLSFRTDSRFDATTFTSFGNPEGWAVVGCGTSATGWRYISAAPDMVNAKGFLIPATGVRGDMNIGLGDPLFNGRVQVDPAHGFGFSMPANSQRTETLWLAAVDQNTVVCFDAKPFSWMTVSDGAHSLFLGAPWTREDLTFNTNGVAPGTYRGWLWLGVHCRHSGRTGGVPFVVEVTPAVSAPTTPSVALETTDMVFRSTEGNAAGARDLLVSNTGEVACSWTAQSNAAWLLVAPVSGRLAVGESAHVSVSVETTSTAGSDRGSVVVRVPGLDPMSVSVTRNVTRAVETQSWQPSAIPAQTVPVAATTLGGQQGSSWSTEINGVIVGTDGEAAVMNRRPALPRLPERIARAKGWRGPVGPPNLRATTLASDMTMATIAGDDGQGSALAATTELGLDTGVPFLLADVLGTYLERSGESNMVQLRGDQAAGLVMWARTFSRDATGASYGQVLTNPRADEVVGSAGGTAVVAGLEDTTTFRSNLFIVETAGQATDVELRYVAENGTESGQTMTENLAPFATLKVVNVLRALGGEGQRGYVTVTSTGGGEVAAVGSVIDNVTNDAFTVMGRVVEAQSSTSALYNPGAAHLVGHGGTVWQSDLVVLNRGAAATIDLAYLPEGGTAAAAASTSTPFTLASGEQRTFRDVVGDALGVNGGKGTVVITSDGIAGLVGFMRTFAKAADGSTSGAGYAAFRDAETLTGPTGKLVLVGLEESPRLRTNLGLANVGDAQSTISVSISVPGESPRNLDLPLGPGQLRQLDRVLTNSVGFSSGANRALAEITLTAEGGRLLAYASVIDNLSNDPATVRAVRVGSVE